MCFLFTHLLDCQAMPCHATLCFTLPVTYLIFIANCLRFNTASMPNKWKFYFNLFVNLSFQQWITDENDLFIIMGCTVCLDFIHSLFFFCLILLCFVVNNLNIFHANNIFWIILLNNFVKNSEKIYKFYTIKVEQLKMLWNYGAGGWNLVDEHHFIGLVCRLKRNFNMVANSNLNAVYSRVLLVADLGSQAPTNIQ